MTAVLVRDDRAWWYLGLDNMAVVRRLRVWRIGPGHLVAVVSQRSADSGTSVTLAAGMIIAQLAMEHPDDHVELIQHHPADAFAPDQFDAVTVQPGGAYRWRLVCTDRLVARLGRRLLSA